MGFTEVHRGLGSFTLNLKQGSTPHDILDAITPFSAVVVTPTHQGPVGNLAASTLLGLASWAGIVQARSNERCTLEGQGPAVLLGDSDGKAGFVSSAGRFDVSKTVADFVAERVIAGGRGNGITTNSVTSSGTTYKVLINPGDTPRKLLDYICDRAGMEWRVNPDFTLDVNTKATLFPTVTTPTTVVRRGAAGRDLNITGLPGRLSVESSWEDYTTTVKVNDNSTTNGSATLSPATTYYNPAGAAVEWQRYITSDKVTTTAGADAIAAAQLGRFDDARHDIRLDTDLYDLSRDVKPGDTLWVFDPPNGLYNLANQVTFRGETIYPTTIRAKATTQPFRQGLGVYLRASDSAGTLYDLTPYVSWESGAAEVEVGAVRRTVVVA